MEIWSSLVARPLANQPEKLERQLLFDPNYQAALAIFTARRVDLDPRSRKSFKRLWYGKRKSTEGASNDQKWAIGGSAP